MVFNGWIDDINEKTRKDFRACIMSVQAVREEFCKLGLANEEQKGGGKFVIQVKRYKEGIPVTVIGDVSEIKKI